LSCVDTDSISRPRSSSDHTMSAESTAPSCVFVNHTRKSISLHWVPSWATELLATSRHCQRSMTFLDGRLGRGRRQYCQRQPDQLHRIQTESRCLTLPLHPCPPSPLSIQMPLHRPIRSSVCCPPESPRVGSCESHSAPASRQDPECRSGPSSRVASTSTCHCALTTLPIPRG
jgi:hypothetical protein